MIGDLAQQRGKLEEAERDFQQAADTTSELLKAQPGRSASASSTSRRASSTSDTCSGVAASCTKRRRRSGATTAMAAAHEPGPAEQPRLAAREGVRQAERRDRAARSRPRRRGAGSCPKQARGEIEQIARSHPEDAVSDGQHDRLERASPKKRWATTSWRSPTRTQDRRGPSRAGRRERPGRAIPGRQWPRRDRTLAAQPRPPRRRAADGAHRLDRTDGAGRARSDATSTTWPSDRQRREGDARRTAGRSRATWPAPARSTPKPSRRWPG